MKISFKELKQYIPLDQNVEFISNILTNSGLEVESVESYSSVRGGLEGLVTGLVLECEQHPNADRLKITHVQINSGAPLQIVCGAPNVAKGQKVVVAPVGTTLYPSQHEPFVIKKAKIRGTHSEGMLCAEDEIGLGMSHDGIMVLPENTPVGIPVKDLFPVHKDTLIEVGLTANRGDAASHLGVARELSALCNIPLTPLLTPELPQAQETQHPVQINIEEEALCPRMSAWVLEGIENKPAPEYIQNFLKSMGLTPKNLVVDTLNYLLHSLGQPMHAYDLDAMGGNPHLEVRYAKEGETLTTLDGVTRTLHSSDCVISNNSGVLSLAGVMGGQTGSVSNKSSRILIESAYFNMGAVRKTAKNHGLNTDSSFRFERGTDPEMTVLALKKAVEMILKWGGGKIAGKLTDRYVKPISPQEINVRYSEIQRICGIQIPTNRIQEILKGLGITCIAEGPNHITVQVPAFKADVTREIDVIEELIRIYGFDAIPLNPHITIPVNNTAAEALENTQGMKNKISAYLRSHGFHEMQNNSMIKQAYQKLNNQNNTVSLLNPLSQDVSILRHTLIPGALESVSYNLKRKASSVLLFEMGKAYFENTDGTYTESNRLCLCAAGYTHPESWERKTQKVSPYFMQEVLSGLAQILGVQQIGAEQGLLFMGTPKQEYKEIADVSEDVIICEIDWDVLAEKAKPKPFTLQNLPKFPLVRRDLSIVIKKEVQFEAIKNIALKTEKKYLQNLFVFDVYEGKPLEADQKSYSVAFILYDSEKTLSDSQIDKSMTQLIKALENEIQALIRK